MINFTMLASRRPKLLQQALRTLGHPDDMRIVILADNASDEVLSYLRNQHEWAYYINKEKSQGTGAARNRVIRWSEQIYGRGDFLYLSDDDVYFHPGWDMAMIQAYQIAYEMGYRVLGAYNHPYHHAVSTTPLWSGWHVREVQALALQSMMMTWEVWDEFGPFNDTAPGDVCLGEDVSFCERIKAAGYKVGVINPPVVANCGLTNSFGRPIPGVDQVRREIPHGAIAE